MNPVHAIRRLAGIVAWLTSVLLASLATASAALASTTPRPTPQNLPPPPPWDKHPPLPAHTHPVASGGMPGWQITLLATGAVLLATAIAVTVYRMRAARRAAATAA